MADTNPALARSTREESDSSFDLVDVDAANQICETLDFRKPAAR